MSAKTYDVVIVGGGHNGLTAACYLSRAGFDVCVLERYHTVGGAAISEEFPNAPGYIASTGSYVLSLAPRTIIDELDLWEHGLELLERNPRFFMPFPDGEYLVYWNDDDQVIDQIRRFSERDARNYHYYEDFVERACQVMDQFILRPPPSWSEFAAAFEGSAADARAGQLDSNERLEFYGDAILGAVVADYLYHRFPDASEGMLTRRRSALVRAGQLTAWARELKLDDYLYLAQSERIGEGGKDRLLAGAFEAMIGAMTIDQGLDFVIRFIHDLLDRDAERVLAGVKFANPKGQLQELTQRRHQDAPEYVIVSQEGPAHQRVFVVDVRFRDATLATGTGSTKRAAEEAAAASALGRIRTEDPNILDNMASGQPDEHVGE